MVTAARAFRTDHEDRPSPGAHSTPEAPDNPDVVTEDLANYHTSTHADVGDIDATWLDEVDEHTYPMGSRGAGEVGLVGAAAAVANAVHHATGMRIRHQPITPDDLLVCEP